MPRWFEFPAARTGLIVLLGVLAFRSFVFSPFTIPSESMLPRLMNGDYLIAAKWPYGYSELSLPFEYPIIPGRIFADLPERGDIVIFKHPVDGTDYVKRVIGLPGDTVALRNGQVILNGRRRAASEACDDFRVAASPRTPLRVGSDGASVRRASARSCAATRRYRETLPSGQQLRHARFRTYAAGQFRPGHRAGRRRCSCMGDNRDNSQDSRFHARAIGGGVGLVADRLAGWARANDRCGPPMAAPNGSSPGHGLPPRAGSVWGTGYDEHCHRRNPRLAASRAALPSSDEALWLAALTHGSTGDEARLPTAGISRRPRARAVHRRLAVRRRSSAPKASWRSA